ncbi:hypothetical protein G6514_007943 [Epicoccum nigrum]|nr:hypothetical protein G6514_007943 [Epicoccum nigrum]
MSSNRFAALSSDNAGNSAQPAPVSQNSTVQPSNDSTTRSEQEPAEDPMDLSSVETKIFKLGQGGKGGDVPRELLEQIRNLNPELYTDNLMIDGTDDSDDLPISTAGIFDLRSSDAAQKMLPQGLENKKKLRTVIYFDGFEGLVGKHLQISPEEAKAADLERKSDQKPQQTHGKKPTKVDPPASECVKVKFRLDTQAPHIELSTMDSASGNIIATRIYGNEFAWNWETDMSKWAVDFRVEPLTYDVGEANYDDGWRNVDGIQKSESYMVLSIRIGFVSGEDEAPVNRTWEGITHEELSQIRASPTASVRDQLITRLDATYNLCIFVSVKATPGNVKMWTEKFGDYFCRLSAITKHFGLFWFYRRQTELALGSMSEDDDAMTDVCEKSDPSKAILQPGMPKVDFVVPRWLVKEWSATVTTDEEGVVSYSDIMPHSWAPLEFPPNFPSWNVAAFLLKLAVQEEQAYQRRGIEALVHSSGGSFFRGRYTHMFGDTYLVHVYLGREKLSQAGAKLPTAGVRIVVKVDRDQNDPPQPATTATLNGVVVDTEDDSNDTFVCVCELQGPRLALANGLTDYATFIEYIIDDLPHQRQLKAISYLQSVNWDGVKHDAAALVFNYLDTKGNEASVKPTARERATFVEGLKKGFKFPPDDSQLRPCMDTLETGSGMTTVIGPPGTGKTLVCMRVAFGHLKSGRRVMATAPTNAAVQTLIDKFVEHNAALGDEGISNEDWLHLTGAHCRIRKASRLQKAQTNEEKLFATLSNAYADYLRSAKDLRNHPRYEQTMGHKLILNIKKWAADPAFSVDIGEGQNLHQLSKKYLEVEDNLPYYEQDQAKKARQDQTIREEILGYELLKRVKFVFCTLSSSAHDIMLESGNWGEIIVDEAARETRAGIATFLAAVHGRYEHITWSGDSMQGSGVVCGRNANTGLNILTRNVFEQLAEVLDFKTAEEATPKGTFILKTCYRMSQSLIDFSNNMCYGGTITSHRTAAMVDRPLRHTLEAFWNERLPQGSRATYEQICFDVTDHGIASKQWPGSTSRYNVDEAHVMAWWIIELLEYKPPTDKKLTRRVKGEDISASANFVDQVSEIRKHLTSLAGERSAYIQREAKDVLTMLGTIGTIQGKERMISTYCTTLAVGHTRLAQNEDLPIGFVADIRNLNVALTRCRVARYVFGAFQLFSQAIRDKLKVVHKHGQFFGYVSQMEQNGCILSIDETRHWMNHRTKPNAEFGFSKSLQAQATYNEPAMQRPAPGNPSALHNVDNKPKTTAKNTPYQQAPAGTQFGGKRDKKGNLLDSGKIKKRGKRGGKKPDPGNKDDGGGDSGIAGASSTPAA